MLRGLKLKNHKHVQKRCHPPPQHKGEQQPQRQFLYTKSVKSSNSTDFKSNAELIQRLNLQQVSFTV